MTSKDFFALSSNIATTIGLPAGVVALLLTYTQIGDARKSLEANTLYAVQKDARDVLTAALAKPDVYDYLVHYDPTKTYTPALKKEALSSIRVVMQFYSSVYVQHRLGVIPNEYWDVFKDEICAFLHMPPVTEFWTTYVPKGKYSASFKQFGNECLNPSPDPCTSRS